MERMLFSDSPDVCHDIPGHSTLCLMFEATGRKCCCVSFKGWRWKRERWEETKKVFTTGPEVLRRHKPQDGAWHWTRLAKVSEATQHESTRVYVSDAQGVLARAFW